MFKSLLLYLVAISTLILCILGDDHDEKECTPKPAVWNTGFFTQEVCHGLYVYGNGIVMGMFLVSDTGVIMVDAPSAMASVWASIPATVQTGTINPITTVIYSHHHGDHIGAATETPNIENVNIICHKKTDEYIAGRPDLAPRCTTTLNLKNNNKYYKIRDGNQEVLITYAGYRWHTDDDLFIFAPKQRTIMTVDLVFSGWVPYKNLGMSSAPDGYRDAHDYLLSITSNEYGDWLNLVGGHVDAIGTRDDVEQNAQYYDELTDAATRAKTNMDFGQFMADHFPNGMGEEKWKFVSLFVDTEAEECDRIMKEEYKWDTKYKGYESFGKHNCWWSIQNLNIKIT